MTRTTACPDWERRIVARETLLPFAPLYPEEADRGMAMFNELRVVDIHGAPTLGAVSRPWVSEFAAQVFGSYNHTTGQREITYFFLLISKKNGKSTIAAGLMLTALLLNERESAEFLILSPTIEVAQNSYKPIRDMIAKDPELTDLFLVQNHIRTITHRITGATLQVVAADSATVSGKKATGVFVDELHEFGKKPSAGDMLLEATGGLASRPEGFVIYATTQSADPPAGIFKEKLLYARKVRDGVVHDPRFLPLLYEYPAHMLKDKSAREVGNLYVTNPNLGCGVNEEHILHLRKQAEEAGEEAMLGFLSKHQNIEIGMALRSDRWAGAGFWVEHGHEHVTLEYLLEHSEVVDAGVDGGGLDDLLALAFVGRHRLTRKWLVWAHAWAHGSVLERRKSEAARFRDFEQDGDLTIVRTMGDDVVGVAKYLAQVEDAGILDKIGVDPHGLGSILSAITSDPLGDETDDDDAEGVSPDYGYCAGISGDKIVGISQGWKLGGAIKTAERKLAEGVIEHGGRPMMAWCVSNARIEPRGNAELITKQASGKAKIDPLMAMLNAVELMSRNPQASGSVYNDRGFMAV